MRCVDWTAGYLDGQVIVALLRAEGLHAHLFDQHTVRQDWFQILAYGGFRVMVPASEFEAARVLTESFRAGTLALADDANDRPACPRCRDGAGAADPRPQRRAFAAYLLWSAATTALLATGVETFAVVVVAFAPWLAMLAVPAWRRCFVGRYRCAACRHAWRAAPEPYARLRDAADAASA